MLKLTNHQWWIFNLTYMHSEAQSFVISAGIAVIQLPWMAMPNKTHSTNYIPVIPAGMTCFWSFSGNLGFG